MDMESVFRIHKGNDEYKEISHGGTIIWERAISKTASGDGTQFMPTRSSTSYAALSAVTAFGGTEQRNLPTEYTQLEYIASTSGTGQYINTGIVPTINAKARVVFAPTSRASTGYWGARNDPNRFCCTTFNPGAEFSVGMTVSSWPVNRTTCTLDTVYDCVMANGYANVDGTEYTETAVESFGNAGYFVLGGSASGQGLQFAAVRFYVCQLWESNVLVFNGIPAKRNSDNALGMYDTVSGAFLTNAGAGTFEAGPVAVPTPDAPMDIVCNNGVLKVSSNLSQLTNIDVEGTTQTETLYAFNIGTPAEDDTYTVKFDYTENNVTYSEIGNLVYVRTGYTDSTFLIAPTITNASFTAIAVTTNPRIAIIPFTKGVTSSATAPRSKSPKLSFSPKRTSFSSAGSAASNSEISDPSTACANAS